MIVIIYLYSASFETNHYLRYLSHIMMNIIDFVVGSS